MNVLLTSLSAKNIHKTLAPWCLKAYCDIALKNENININIDEYTINQPIYNIFDSIYLQKPDVVGFSCYIWNIEETEKICRLIKECLPDTIILIGGPEVSFDANEKNAYSFADYIMVGAGEKALAELLLKLKTNTKNKNNRVISSQPVPFANLPSPFTEEYFNSFSKSVMLSIKNQLVYYESSRGCPFSCAYCLSSATDGVDFIPIERVKSELKMLISKGATCIKFVDRTFNAKKKRAIEILKFIKTLDTNCTFHFEVAADLFNTEMLNTIKEMPVERVQFEIGIQSTNIETLNQVCRKTDLNKVLENIKILTSFNNCHVHVDLIAGLPHDTIKTFSLAVNDCINTNAHMLQLGFLKLLKGSALRKDAEEFNCVYSYFPPYQVLKTSTTTAEDLIFLKSIEEVIEKFYNTGIYKNSLNYGIELFGTPYKLFESLAKFCDGKNLRLSVKNSYTLLLNFLLNYGNKELVKHYIKLDSFTYNANFELPDNIQALRDKKLERKLKLEYPKNTHLKIINFKQDNTKRIFFYTKKHPISREFKVEILNT